MSEKPTIQKLRFVLLLVLFTISFIPKSYFHEVLADHTDVVSCEHPGANATCVHQQGLRCDVEDLVVTAPYVCSSDVIWFHNSFFAVTRVTPLTEFALQQHFPGTESRGPPSAIII